MAGLTPQHTFESLGLSPESLDALNRKGFEAPTAIQSLVIPLVLGGQCDIIGQAGTGTGKTAAFGLPLLEKIAPRAGGVQALVLTPTRELAIQVAEELNSLRGARGHGICPIYGGQALYQQVHKLKAGVDVVVGTPGRVIDHLTRGTLDLSALSFVVLDEADEMLAMGFIEEVEKILEAVGPQRRMLLFSATMPDRIRRIAERHMRDHERLRVDSGRLADGLTEQIYFEVHEQDKLEALCRIIDMEEHFYGLVFCRTKINVDELVSRLMDRGYEAEGLHGDIGQPQRELILNRFRKRQASVLVATDVAARGIDINNLSHVINYSLPQDPEAYIHRIGRTGRAGREGIAITFATPAEYHKLSFIRRFARTDIRRERLPAVDDVIRVKRERIVTRLKETEPAAAADGYEAMAGELLEGRDPVQVLAAVLKHTYQDKLDPGRYRDIGAVDRAGKSRLHIQLGRRDGMDKRSLIDLLERESGLHRQLIRDARVHDLYSVVSVPFHEAETVIKAFRKRNRGKRPLVAVERGPGAEGPKRPKRSKR